MRGGAEDEAEDGRRRFYSKPRGEPIVAGWKGLHLGETHRNVWAFAFLHNPILAAA